MDKTSAQAPEATDFDKTSAEAHKATHFLHSLDTAVFRHPKVILSIILAITVFFAAQIPGVKMYSDFADLLPQEHTYIELHNEIKESFGGANVIIVGHRGGRGRYLQQRSPGQDPPHHPGGGQPARHQPQPGLQC